MIVSYHSYKPEPPPTPAPQPKQGQIKITASYKELVGKSSQEVIAALKKMGFTNVKSKPLGDLINGWIDDEYEVKEVSIGGVTKFSAGEIFDKNVEIIVSYHSYK